MMKKFILVIFLLVGLMSLVGCSSSDSSSDSDSVKSFKGQHFDREELEYGGTIDWHVDDLGNIVYNGTKEDSVIPFSQLTVEQIKILEKKGAKFPDALLKEKGLK